MILNPFKKKIDTWPAERKAILKANSNRCQKCNALNAAVGFRNESGRFIQVSKKSYSKHDRISVVNDSGADKRVKIIMISLAVGRDASVLCQKCRKEK